MTDRHHAGEDIDTPGLEDIREDADPDDRREASELLEGLLGPGAAERDDVPTADQHPAEDPQDGGVEETVIGRWACRFCETERRSPSGVVSHHATCPDSKYYRDTHWENDEADNDSGHEESTTINDPDEASLPAGDDSPGERRTFLIDAQWHEFRAYLKFSQHGLQPYYALHQLMRRVDWNDGPPSRVVEYDGREYLATFTYHESGLLPWDDESFRIQKVREFRLHLETSEGVRKADFLIRPRWPNMESKEGVSAPTNPRDFLGVDVDTQGANHDPEMYPELLDIAMQAFGVNGGARDERDRYLSPANVEPWSIVIDGEQYVRIDEDHSGPLIGLNGPIERMNMVLAGERSGYRKRVADDQKTAGYYHTVTFGSRRAGKIIKGHRLAKEVKHYHVKHGDKLDEDDPLRHPKLGVSYQRSRSDARVYWDRKALESDQLADETALGLADLDRELDEQLLNTLRWAGLPTRPDRQVYVDDAVFTVEPRRRERTLVPDSLPALEQKQEHMVTRAITKMCDPERYDTDARVVQTLLSDGGELSPTALAEDLDVHYETILRSLKRLEDVVDHSYGSVELKSHHLAQQLAERAGDLLGDFERWHEHVDQLAAKVARFVDGTAEEDSAFDRWVEKYLEGIDDPDNDPRVYLRMGYRPEDAHAARDILERGLTSLRTTFGSKNADGSRLARKGRVELTLADGTPASMEFAPRVT